MKLITRDILKLLVALSSVNAEIEKEVTEFGITLLKGNQQELDTIKNDIEELAHQLDSSSRKRRSPNPFSGAFRSFIVQQIAENIDKEFKVLFDSDVGPMRGAYDMAAVDSKLYSTGLKKDSEEYGDLPLPRSHYCRYREPTDEEGEEASQCCEGENKKCYTDAGCFCDVSCYTKYGDCCTDHFVKCYQKLKLCLITIDDEGAAKEQEMGSKKQNFVGKDKHQEYADHQSFENAMIGARSMKPFLVHMSPDQVKPNDCCGQKPYHNEDIKDGKHPLCCNGVLSWDVPNAKC